MQVIYTGSFASSAKSFSGLPNTSKFSLSFGHNLPTHTHIEFTSSGERSVCSRRSPVGFFYCCAVSRRPIHLQRIGRLRNVRFSVERVRKLPFPDTPPFSVAEAARLALSLAGLPCGLTIDTRPYRFNKPARISLAARLHTHRHTALVPI